MEVDSIYFKHEALDLSTAKIRLFKVNKQFSEDGLIQGTIKHTRLARDHVCLSYMWGRSR